MVTIPRLSGTAVALQRFVDATAQSGSGSAMKIYLLMLLIAALLTAVHFTAPSNNQRESARQ
jgi:hypothetical protein